MITLYLAILLMNASIIAYGYFIINYAKALKNSAASISIIIAVMVSATMELIHITDTDKLLLMSFATLMLTSVVMILCVIFKGETKEALHINWKSHLWFLLSGLCLGTSICLFSVKERQLSPSFDCPPTVENISAVIIRPLIVEHKESYDVGDWGNGGGSYVSKIDTVDMVYVILQGGRKIEIETAVEGKDYEALYPIGDTVTVYQGEFIIPRN